MTQLNRQVIVWMSILSFSANISLAATSPKGETIRFIIAPITHQDAPSCDTVLSACAKAVSDQQNAIEEQKRVIAQLKAASVDDRAALAKSQDKGILQNPAFLILLGVVGGVVIGGKVIR